MSHTICMSPPVRIADRALSSTGTLGAGAVRESSEKAGQSREQAASGILRRLLELTGSSVGMTFLERTVEALGDLLDADMALFARVDHGPPRRATVLATWNGGSAAPSATYDMAGMPSDLLYSEPATLPDGVGCRDGIVTIWRGAGKLFPNGTRRMEAYVGLRIVNAVGEPIAHLLATFGEPIVDTDRQDLIIGTARFFVARVEAELQRLDADAERMAALKALSDETDRLRVTLHAIGDGVIVTDRDERITMLNPAAEELIGIDAVDVLGRPIGIVAGLTGADASARPLPPARVAMEERRVVSPHEDGVLIGAGGRKIAVDVSAAPVIGKDGSVIGSVTVLHDVTEARALFEHVQHLANFDAVTGLPNRALFLDRMEQAILLASRHQRRFAVLMLEVDRFKTVNDAFGHAPRDALLVDVAGKLLSTIRASDTVARIGGDEFVILLNDVSDGVGAAVVAGKILDLVGKIESVEGHAVDVAFSIGIARFPDDAEDADTLLMRADAAVYQAKVEGRNAYSFFDAETERAAQRRGQLRAGLARALPGKQFALVYQPKFDLLTSALTGAEALLRWHPQAGVTVSPVDFIPIAEESGMIVPIGAWVIEEACAQLRLWQSSGLSTVPVSINASMRSLCLPDFAERLQSALDASQITPGALEIEITETAAMTDPKRLLKALEQIRHCGVRVSVDDFGTGHSSLAYLQRLPIDTIKIDRSFTNDSTKSPEGEALIRAIISMATALHKHVIAEGIETEAERELLLRVGCREAQGFLFSRPLDAAAFEVLLRDAPKGSIGGKSVGAAMKPAR